ncbi:TPA: hypothetical protein QDC03_005598 [Burkholderia cepacia]|uniref:hypothetical protein n=1 Tax=Burkholderia cepacia TaxID=292 RepID=UPI0011B1F65B|nr:hypothetical protein [Burkholderia cepacia]HDR9510432.1 hypothetical protein [Burkholderia cepacia]
MDLTALHRSGGPTNDISEFLGTDLVSTLHKRLTSRLSLLRIYLAHAVRMLWCTANKPVGVASLLENVKVLLRPGRRRKWY